jgi:WD40 repeat protein/energy-coupling factor transporter ATP-binding protein EcfA2
MASIFISHSSADAEITETTVQELRRAGFKALFVDLDPENGIIAGQSWERQLYAQLRIADAVVFLASPAAIASRWCAIEIGLARSIGRPIVPALIAGDERLSLLDDVQWVDVRSQDHEAFGRLLNGLRRVGADPRDSFAFDPDRSPYPGLEAFAMEDAAVFFGRRSETAELRDKLQPTLQRARGQFVLVVGPSGSGKSSLVAAGLIPQLSRTPDRWTIVPPFAPGQQPLDQLSRSLARALNAQAHPADASDVARQLAGGPGALIEMAQLLCENRARHSIVPRVLLVVDQAEELVTRASPEEGARFLRMLRGALDLDSPLWIVATMRSEFLSLSLNRVGAADVFDDIYAVGPLRGERLPQVVEGPARRAGIDFEVGLVQRMVRDTVGGDSLPLLAFTLRQLYELATPGEPIRQADYETIGGVVGALRRQANNTLAKLMLKYDKSKVLATLLRLVSIEQGGELARRPVQIEMLGADELRIMQAFVDARLLHTKEINGGTVVEAVHEALLRQWDPLTDAITESRQVLLIRSEIEHTARAWREAGYDKSYLPRGVRLAAASEEWPSRTEILGPLEQEFLAASKALARSEVETAHRSNRRLRRLIVGLVALLLAVGSLSIVAVQERNLAEAQRRVAVARGLVTEANALRDSRPQTSLMLGIAAMRLDPSEHANASLITTLTQTHFSGTLTAHAGHIWGVAISPDGRTLATASGDKTAILWDISDHDKPSVIAKLSGHTAGVSAVAFSRDGRTLATGSADKTVILWDVADRAHPNELAILIGHSKTILSVAFSPDGYTLGTSSGDHTAILWDISKPAIPRRQATLLGHSAPVEALAFSPSGKILATASFDGTAILWKVMNRTNPKVMARLRNKSERPLFALAFDRTGETLAIGGSGNNATLWDVTNLRNPQIQSVVGAHTDSVSALEFSPQGDIFATASFDKTIVLWKINDRAHPVVLNTLRGHSSDIDSLAFSPDGMILATAGADRSVMLWNVIGRATPDRLSTLSGIPQFGSRATYSPEGQVVATSGIAALWDVSRPTEPTRLSQFDIGNRVHLLAFSPDGHTLATNGLGKAVELWDVSNSRQPRSLIKYDGVPTFVQALAFKSSETLAFVGDDFTLHIWDVGDLTRPVKEAIIDDTWSVAFSPDGNTMVTGGVKGATLWDVTDPIKPRSVAKLTEGVTTSEAMRTATFSPDGRTVVAGMPDGTVDIWDVSELMHPTIRATLSGHTDSVVSIAFSPDAQTLVTGSYDKSIMLWDLSENEHPTKLATLTTQKDVVQSLAFSRDGRTLLSASDGVVAFWNMTERLDIVNQPFARACAIAGRGLNADEWARYAPELPYQDTCPS